MQYNAPCFYCRRVTCARELDGWVAGVGWDRWIGGGVGWITRVLENELHSGFFCPEARSFPAVQHSDFLIGADKFLFLYTFWKQHFRWLQKWHFNNWSWDGWMVEHFAVSRTGSSIAKKKKERKKKNTRTVQLALFTRKLFGGGVPPPRP